MKGPGYRDTATCQENHSRFVQWVVASGQVWGLEGPNGWAYAESNEDERTHVLLFWSDEPYARRAQSEFPDHSPTPITLFDFLYRWLPGMSGDGVLAGTNWTGDLVGLEENPFELRVEIEAKLPHDVIQQHKAMCKEITGKKT